MLKTWKKQKLQLFEKNINKCFSQDCIWIFAFFIQKQKIKKQLEILFLNIIIVNYIWYLMILYCILIWN